MKLKCKEQQHTEAVIIIHNVFGDSLDFAGLWKSDDTQVHIIYKLIKVELI